MKWFVSLLLFVVTLFAGSCEYPCIKAEVYFGLVGFSNAESDTIILRRFTGNANNSVLKDTFLLNDIWFERHNDTLKMVGYPGTAILESNYNYEIFFPATGKVVKLTDIKEEQLHGKRHGDVICVNRITGYKLDAYTNTTVGPDNIIYLTK